VSKKRGPYSSALQQDRRLRIIRAAAVQLEKVGFDALTMQSIAETSEVSTKTLYNLFGSRESLLLEAGSERLIDLEQSDSVLSAEAGIPRLLAYTVGAMRQFEETPEYARVIISILVRTDLDYETAGARLRPVQRFSHASLTIAAQQGELRAGLDLTELSYLIAANQWGVVLLWENGLLGLEELEPKIRLSHYLTLAPLCLGARKELMEEKLNELISGSTTGTSESKQATQKK
jgi:AcrR family transcriptional regulator